MHESYMNAKYVHIARDVYIKLGAIYYQRGMCREAIDAFENVGGRDEMAVVAKGLMADCYEREGRNYEAFEAYREVLEISPGHVSALEGLARCYDAAGRPDEADRIRRQLSGGE